MGRNREKVPYYYRNIGIVKFLLVVTFKSTNIIFADYITTNKLNMREF